ncbi:MAG: polyribonucleotide nucleotidyltransferase, partial [Deltaproteobacteria bacterium]
MSHRKEIEFAGQKYLIETGRLAKQAGGSVMVQFGETIVLAAVCASTEPVEGQDFFPLQIEYRERAYAAGKIPGGFLKREGRPSDQEILCARLIDRPIRPLFPDGFFNEVQVMVMVLSADRQNDADVLGITATSAALSVSEVPFEGPIAGVRVGRINGEFIANPTFEQRAVSDMDIVIAASEDSIIMVEGEAQEISEEDMIKALAFGHEQIRILVQMQKEFVVGVAKPKMVVSEKEDLSELTRQVRQLCGDALHNALMIAEKQERHNQMDALTESTITQLAETFPEKDDVIKSIIHDYEREVMREMVLQKQHRLDGRGLDDIRPISIEVGVLPRAHGSALFTRGQTQALAATTLGTKMDEQLIEGLEGTYYKNYMLHYNFPPFSTGEVKAMRGTSRREIGHGNLAERSLKPSIPADGVFPYTIRIVSDILESNGSSSMATVCAGTMALMDAGIKLVKPVSGIAMGLITDNKRYVVLSDILGDEDHLGDMDFKVCGTRDGITACQMDIKV